MSEGFGHDLSRDVAPARVVSESTDWTDVTARVVVEACAAHADDVVLVRGRGLDGIESRVRRVVRFPVEGLSIVAFNDVLEHLAMPDQRVVLAEMADALPERGLFVIGGKLFSFAPEDIDEPEQFGGGAHAQRIETLERWLRDLGFLPDTHRFGPGRAVIIALKASRSAGGR